jgi:diguanylate cyclase (GGDEF)-like protein
MARHRRRAHQRRFFLLAAAASMLLTSAAHALAPDKAITQYHHEYWLPEDGLPQVSVHSILQTRDHYLWLATQEGLVRFDGARFVVFDTRNNDAITNNYISDLLEARDGTLWIGTNGGGLVRFRDGEFDTITQDQGLSSNLVQALSQTDDQTIWVGTDAGLDRIGGEGITRHGVADGLTESDVETLFTDRDDNLWIGTRGGGLTLYRDGAFGAHPANDELSNPLVSALHQATDGTVWIGTSGGGLYAAHKGRLTGHGLDTGLSSLFIESILEDSDGNLWVGTYDGGICRRRDGRFDCLTTAEGLRHDNVKAIFEDAEANLWIGTLGGGLNRLRDAKFTSYTTQEGLSHDGTWAVLQGRDGVWLGTEEGLNLLRDGEFVDFPGRAETSNDSLMAIHEEPDGTLWTGLYGGGLRRLRDGRWTTWTTANDLADDQVYCIVGDGSGGTWVGTEGGLSHLVDGQFTTYTTRDGLPSDTIKALHVDRDGTLWIGTRGGGLARYQYGEFIQFSPRTELTQNQKLVYSIHEDAQGTLWFGTLGGLLRHRNGETHAFTTDDGMYDDTIFRVLEDDSRTLWMSCNRGVYSVQKQVLDDYVAGRVDRIDYHAYGRADGMPSDECNGGGQPSGTRTDDGQLWFPTVGGFGVIDPSNIVVNTIAPPVMIEEVRIDGAPVDHGQEPILPAGRKRISVRFAALSLTASERVRFRYQLDPIDREWSSDVSQREVLYSSIPHGDYTFRVLACNNDGTWADTPAEFHFQIRPRFHETPLFYVLAVFTVFGLIAGLVSIRIRRLNRRAAELAAAVEDRTRDLRKLTEELTELSLRDPLTGLRNRRFLFETVAAVMEDLARQRSHASGGGTERRGRKDWDVIGLFMVDIDHFKEVNDTYGHDAGDAVLRHFADLLRECVRVEDIVVRWGGEEFLLVLPHTRADFVDEFAERLRRAVDSADFELPAGGVLKKTCSVGYTSFPFSNNPQVELTMEQVITVADLGLYKAKRDGRNRCVHVIAGDSFPADHGQIVRGLADLDWALQKDYLAIEE